MMKFNSFDRELIQALLPKLNTRAQSLIQRLENEGYLVSGQIEAGDVVDTVIAKMHRHFEGDIQFKDAFNQSAKQLGKFLAALCYEFKNREKLEVSTDDLVSVFDRKEEILGLGDQSLDFNVPEEVWHQEDIIADLRFPSPEEEYANKEQSI